MTVYRRGKGRVQLPSCLLEGDHCSAIRLLMCLYRWTKAKASCSCGAWQVDFSGPYEPQAFPSLPAVAEGTQKVRKPS